MTPASLDLNWLAVLAAAASTFVLGGIWYGPLFKRAWCRENGMDPDAAPIRHPGATFAVAGLCSLVAAFAFALFLRGDTPPASAAMFGGILGLFWVATSFGINYAFAGRTFKLWAIDAGYHILQFSLYGLILGSWR